ncbi:UDP-glycosyltransferase UGT5-like isoform X2 [Homalodisca vitripennis]|nr:UDP-glycosyltransferase UGT5-like isoform X2 [Homalodisca vitripennis]
MRYLIIWVLALCVVDNVLSMRILAVLPFPGKSHHIFSTGIMRALAERGHEIVEYSPYPPVRPIPNHTHIEFHSRFEQEIKSWTYEDFMKYPAQRDKSIFGFKIRRIWEINYSVCEDMLQNEKIQYLLRSKEKFDVVLTEATFGEESMLVFGHRFSAPTVCIEGFFPWSILNRYAGNSLSIASVPDFTSMVFKNELLSFKDRLLNFISISRSLFHYYYTHLPLHDQILKQNYKFSNTPSVIEMVKNVSLYLTNSHPAVINYIQPYTPNIVPIGGIHINPQTSSVPQDVLKFMDDAKEGFIYFGLGSLVPTHLMPNEVLNTFINVFRKLPQRVLWKIDSRNLSNLPSNVMTKPWTPQLNVLGHKNCRLFITHGGLFSHQEAIHAGVPTVGIPFFADQPYNVQYSQLRGRGVWLDFATLSEETFTEAISKVLNNSQYRENAARLARIYRDRPMSPVDSAVFWVEYIVRHGGAQHLRPAAALLPWYQLYLLDVVSAVVATILLTVFTIIIIIRKIFTVLFNKKGSKRVSNHKKNK